MMGSRLGSTERSLEDVERFAAEQYAVVHEIGSLSLNGTVEDAQAFILAKLEELQAYIQGVILDLKKKLGVTNEKTSAETTDQNVDLEGSTTEPAKVIVQSRPSEEKRKSKKQTVVANAKEVEAAKQQIEDKIRKTKLQIRAKTQEVVSQPRTQALQEPLVDKSFTGLAGIMVRLQALLADYDTIRAEIKSWRDHTDLGIIHESPGKYVVQAGSGFFPNRTVPAYKFLKVAEKLVSVAVAKDNSDRLDLLKEANSIFEQAWWDGVDANTKQPKKNFLTLRRDYFANSESAYNETLAEIRDICESLFSNLKADDDIGKNIFASIGNIVACVSIPEKPPLNLTNEDLAKSIKIIKKSLDYMSQELRLRR